MLITVLRSNCNGVGRDAALLWKCVNCCLGRRHKSGCRPCFQFYASDPPASFSRVTLAQLIAADKALWTILARDVESVKPDANGNRPWDAAVDKLICDPRVTMHMLSMPNKATAAASTTTSTGQPSGGETSSPGIRPKKKARPGKRNRPTLTPPEELKACYQSTSDGKPICCSYNLSNGCSLNATGQPPRCTKGVHMCAFCRRVGHSFQNCKAAPGKKDGH